MTRDGPRSPPPPEILAKKKRKPCRMPCRSVCTSFPPVGGWHGIFSREIRHGRSRHTGRAGSIARVAGRFRRQYQPHDRAGSRRDLPVGSIPGIGLDIEAARSLDQHLIESVLTVEEGRNYAPDDVDPTVLFSCKEAVYKAVYPRFREFLEFHDVEIDFRGADFLATLQAGKSIGGLDRERPRDHLSNR